MIVLVSLVAGSIGMAAVVLMKVLELWQLKMSSVHPETEPDQPTSTETQYGSIQKGKVHYALKL